MLARSRRTPHAVQPRCSPPLAGLAVCAPGASAHAVKALGLTTVGIGRNARVDQRQGISPPREGHRRCSPSAAWLTFTTSAGGTFSTGFAIPQATSEETDATARVLVQGGSSARRELPGGLPRALAPKPASEAAPAGRRVRQARQDPPDRKVGRRARRAPLGRPALPARRARPAPAARRAPPGRAARRREPVAPGGAQWIPPQHLTWYWQLQGTVNNSRAGGRV